MKNNQSFNIDTADMITLVQSSTASVVTARHLIPRCASLEILRLFVFERKLDLQSHDQ